MNKNIENTDLENVRKRFEKIREEERKLYQDISKTVEHENKKDIIPGFHANEKLDAEAVAAQEAGLTYGQYKMRKYMEEMKKRGE